MRGRPGCPAFATHPGPREEGLAGPPGQSHRLRSFWRRAEKGPHGPRPASRAISGSPLLLPPRACASVRACVRICVCPRVCVSLPLCPFVSHCLFPPHSVLSPPWSRRHLGPSSWEAGTQDKAPTATGRPHSREVGRPHTLQPRYPNGLGSMGPGHLPQLTNITSQLQSSGPLYLFLELRGCLGAGILAFHLE